MKDCHIRKKMHLETIPRRHNKGSLIIDEFNMGKGMARADVIVVDDHIYGYEIKSEKDTLYRLRKQVPIYNAACERPIAVVAEKHLKKLPNYIDPWWGIYVVTGTDDDPIVEKVVEGWVSEELDTRRLLNYLWKRELATYVHGLPGDHGRRFWSLFNEAMSDLTPEEAAIVVNRALKGRARSEDWFRDFHIL